MMPIIEGGVARMPGSYYVRPVKQIEEGWSLRVTKSGSGTGTVTSDLSPGIDCGSSCYFFFLAGSTVVLTATPDTGKSFVGWSGDGTGTTTRTVIMNGNKVVNAEFILWNPENIHNIYDLTTEGSFIYAVGNLVYGSYYKAAITKLTMGGVIVSNTTYEPVANSKGWWGAVCVSGNFVYVGGTIIYPTESKYRAVIHKLNKSDLSLVWEYKFPLQTYDCDMKDIDVDGTDVYGVKESYDGTAIHRIRIAIADGSEVWRLGPTVLAGVGIICNANNVYLTKSASGSKTIEDITKSTGAKTDRLIAGESGNFARGVISGSDLYLCGYYQNAGLWNPSIHKINTSTWNQTWKYTDVGTNMYFPNCVKYDDGVYALGYLSDVVLLRLDLDGNLIWRQTILGGYFALYGISQFGDYLYIGIHKNNIGTIQKRLKSTGELFS